MKHKLMMKYPLISILLVAAALCLLGLPFGEVNADPPDPTPTPAMGIRTKLQPYQTPGVEPSQSDGWLFEEAPAPSEVEGEAPIGALAQQTFYSIADATVLQGYPSINFGDTADMWAGYDECLEPPGRIARSQVKFNIAGLSPNRVITKATLRVRLINSCDFPNTSRRIRAYRITGSWSESSVTWNNRPGYGGSYGSQSILHGDWDWYEFDVTDLVRAWYNRTYTNHGIMLRGPETPLGWRGFSTREGPYRPQLVVEYVTPTPPPTTPPPTTPPPTTPPPTTPPPTDIPTPTQDWKVYLPIVMKDWSPSTLPPTPTNTPTPTSTPTPTPTPTSTPTFTPTPGVVPEPGTWYCYPSSLTIRFTVSSDSSSVSNGRMTAPCGSVSIAGPVSIANGRFTLLHSDGINFISGTFDDVDEAHGSFGFWRSSSCWALGNITCTH